MSSASGRKAIGELGEELARKYLKKHGYHVIETNYRCRHGEIDIVTRRRDSLVFVEVRTKTSDAFGTPEESVTAAKQERLVATAQTYLASHQGLPESWRIDVVAVELHPDGKVKRIEQVENAVC